MRRFLELFPESVIIRSIDYVTKIAHYYANEKFDNSIVDLKDLIINHEHQKIIDTLQSIKVTINSFDDMSSSNSEVFININDFLRQREEEVKGDQIMTSTCKIFNSEESKNNDFHDEIDYKVLTVKSLKVNWENNPDSYLHVLIDNTDIHKLEKAKNNNRCQKIMFTSASHEFRTPLNAIMNSFELIKMIVLNEESNLPKEIQKLKLLKYVNMGSTSASLLLSLVEDILNLSRLETGNFKLNNGWFNVEELLKEVYEMFYFQCKQKNLKLELL